MTPGDHSDIGPELRQLAQTILDRLDPAVRAAAATAADPLRGPGRCQQVWCPFCAVAALISGEQHPMLTVLAEHSVALMAMLRTMAADPQGASASDVPGQKTDESTGDTAAEPRRNGSGRYQSIPIVVEPGAEH